MGGPQPLRLPERPSDGQGRHTQGFSNAAEEQITHQVWRVTISVEPVLGPNKKEVNPLPGQWWWGGWTLTGLIWTSLWGFKVPTRTLTTLEACYRMGLGIRVCSLSTTVK